MKKLTLALICLLAALTCQGRTIIVEPDSSGEYPTIQVAIDNSKHGDVIILSLGTYTGPGNRDIDFKGKAVMLRSENGPENCIIDCNGTETDPHRGFYFHNGEDANSVLSGFTITNGHHDSGGGIYCYNSSPTIANCTITGNTVGGICCMGDISPTITNCTITGNTANASGGGIYCNSRHSPAIITNCTISDNSAGYTGGGICCPWTIGLTVIDCTITDNSANERGGGIGCWHSPSDIINCIIAGNSAGYGGAIACDYYSSSTIINCTITNNLAGYGGGIYSRDNDTMISNCILCANEATDGPEIYLGHRRHHSGVWVNYTDVQGGESSVYVGPDCTLNWGPGNIDADPCFVDPGCWADANDPNIIVEPNAPNAIWIEGDYHLYPFSLCINAGDPNYIPGPNETDLDGNPRVIAGRIDMGAYESNHIEARLWILPRTINRHSRQKRVWAWLRLPQGIAKDDIDSNTPLLLYPGEIEPTRQFVFQNNRRRIKRTSIIACFDKRDLMDVISNNGRRELKLVGRLKTGQYFYGSDTVRVINRRPPPRR